MKIVSVNVGMPRQATWKGQTVSTGIYFAVEREGEEEAGDGIEKTGPVDHDVTVLDITLGYSGKRNDPAHLARVSGIESLPERWRGGFRHRLERMKDPS